MRAGVLAVGTELLLGQIANTNARTISEALAEAGIDVAFHAAVGDNLKRIAEAIAAAVGRVDALVVTGGLGPTHDDLTREGIALATGRALEARPELAAAVAERFRRQGRAMAPSNLRQAEQPEGAVPIPNPLGTAPGVRLDHGGTRIYALPGVPAELEAMLAGSVLPDLRARAGPASIASRVLKVAGMAEADVGERLRPLIAGLAGEPGVTLALLSSAGEVRVRLTAKARDREEALRRIEPSEREARALLGPAVFGADDDTLEASVSRLLRERGLTLAVAESVTGGLVTARIVSVPGASDLLLAGYVAYSTAAKVRDLAVPPEVLDRHGAVSVEAAAAMARGARERAGAAVGLSTTGEAGPAPAEAEAGAVCIGLAWDAGSASERMVLPGDRETVRRRAAQAALVLLRRWLLGEAG